MAKMLAHVQNPIPSIRQFRDDIPPELSAVLDRMLAKEPDERFGTPGEVVTALEAFTTDCNPAGLLEKAQQAARAAAVADKSLASTEPYHASAFVGTEPSHVPQITNGCDHSLSERALNVERGSFLSAPGTLDTARSRSFRGTRNRRSRLQQPSPSLSWRPESSGKEHRYLQPLPTQ